MHSIVRRWIHYRIRREVAGRTYSGMLGRVRRSSHRGTQQDSQRSSLRHSQQNSQQDSHSMLRSRILRGTHGRNPQSGNRRMHRRIQKNHSRILTGIRRMIQGEIRKSHWGQIRFPSKIQQEIRSRMQAGFTARFTAGFKAGVKAWFKAEGFSMTASACFYQSASFSHTFSLSPVCSVWLAEVSLRALCGTSRHRLSRASSLLT